MMETGETEALAPLLHPELAVEQGALSAWPFTTQSLQMQKGPSKAGFACSTRSPPVQPARPTARPSPVLKGTVARGAIASPYRSGQRSLNPFVMAGSAIHQRTIRPLISEYSYTVPSRRGRSNKFQTIFSCSRISATTRNRRAICAPAPRPRRRAPSWAGAFRSYRGPVVSVRL